MTNQIKQVEEFAPGCRHAIINHPKHGVLYLREMKNFEGDNFGIWTNGFIAQIKSTDTLESLQTTIWNTEYQITLLDAMLHGYDSDRPLLNWPGYVIVKIAESAGL